MSSSIRRPSVKSDPPKPRFAKPNPVRAMREREERQRAQAAASQQSQASSSRDNKGGSVALPARQQCPNKACPKPNVIDGTCRTCGRVADDSNIVAEVQFGETSSGAAVVQGSFIGADQAGVRSMGPAFRRVGGSEDREKSIREARGLMQGYAQQLNVSESLVTAGTQVFKLASGANFIQGRTLASVAAVCLYAACRAEPPCKVMLIDLENTSYNIRGKDIGLLFSQFLLSNFEQGSFPDEDYCKEFLLEYQQETQKLGYIEDFDPKGKDSLDHLYFESLIGTLVSALCFNLFLMRYHERFFSFSGSWAELNFNEFQWYLDARELFIKRFPDFAPNKKL